MIRDDLELLAELASVNTGVVPLAMRIMEGSATGEEQYEFAERLISLGQRLHRRAEETQLVVIEGTAIPDYPVALSSGDDAGEGNHQNL